MRRSEQIRYLLLAAQREGNRRLAAALSKIELSPAQSEILRILGDHNTLPRIGVGQMLVCDSGTSPSRLVERLVDAGFIDRTADLHDRRQVHLALTPAGQEKELQVRTIENALYDELDALPGADEFVSTLELLVTGLPAGKALKLRIG